MRLRFTIRDLLWLTLVVALVVGWWVDHRHLAPRPTELGPGIRPYPVSDLVFPVRPSDD